MLAPGSLVRGHRQNCKFINMNHWYLSISAYQIKKAGMKIYNRRSQSLILGPGVPTGASQSRAELRSTMLVDRHYSITLKFFLYFWDVSLCHAILLSASL